MGVYKLCWKESVRKDFRLLPSAIIARVIKKIESLPVNPVPVDSKKLRDTEHTYRVRVGDYRIIYRIDIQRSLVTIVLIKHRKDDYDE